jgi:Spy/CpxP family protein refolding chaperone
MRRFARLGIAAGIVAVMTVAAPADDAKITIKAAPLFDLGKWGLIHLQSKDVQKDLKITDEQLPKLRDLAVEQRDAKKDLPKDNEQRTKKLEEIARQAEETLQAILTDKQLSRLKQIQLQYYFTQNQGVSFLNGDIAKALTITKEQEEKIQQTLNDALKAQVELLKEDPKELQKKFVEHQTKYLEKTVAILSPKQQLKWKLMLGEPFTGKPYFARPEPVKPKNAAPKEEKKD